MAAPLTGSCLCRAVRFEVRGDLGSIVHCHCESCRKAQGGAFATNAPAARDAFVVVAGADEITRYESSPGKFRCFCRRCGSPVFSESNAVPGTVRIRLGTLDGDPGGRPVLHVWAGEKAPWFELTDDLPRLPAGTPAPGARDRARALAREAIAAREPLAWFERLYREAAAGTTVVPWADRVPNPHLVEWLDGRTSRPGRALDVGTGLGDNAEELARRGWDVVAFDVAPSAIDGARRRFPGSRVEYAVADLLAPPAEWRQAFDLVVETYTLQVLPPRERADAARRLATLVAPGGTLLVIARGREPDEPEGAMPWPLTRAEVDAIGRDGLVPGGVDDFRDAEDPPVRRFRATFRRP